MAYYNGGWSNTGTSQNWMELQNRQTPQGYTERNSHTPDYVQSQQMIHPTPFGQPPPSPADSFLPANYQSTYSYPDCNTRPWNPYQNYQMSGYSVPIPVKNNRLELSGASLPQPPVYDLDLSGHTVPSSSLELGVLAFDTRSDLNELSKSNNVTDAGESISLEIIGDEDWKNVFMDGKPDPHFSPIRNTHTQQSKTKNIENIERTKSHFSITKDPRNLKIKITTPSGSTRITSVTEKTDKLSESTNSAKSKHRSAGVICKLCKALMEGGSLSQDMHLPKYYNIPAMLSHAQRHAKADELDVGRTVAECFFRECRVVVVPLLPQQVAYAAFDCEQYKKDCLRTVPGKTEHTRKRRHRHHSSSSSSSSSKRSRTSPIIGLPEYQSPPQQVESKERKLSERTNDTPEKTQNKGDEEDMGVSIGLTQCDLCELELEYRIPNILFRQQKGLNELGKHILKRHLPKERPFNCSSCPFAAKSVGKIERHIRETHPGDTKVTVHGQIRRSLTETIAKIAKQLFPKITFKLEPSNP